MDSTTSVGSGTPGASGSALPEIEAPAGHGWRRPTPEDLPLIAALHDRCDVDRIGEVTGSGADVARDLIEPAARDEAIVVFPADRPDVIAAYALFQEDRDPWTGDLDLYLEGRVDPDHTGHELATFLLDRGVRRARLAARSAGEERVTLVTSTANEDRRARNFYLQNEFAPARHLLRLRLDLEDLPPRPPLPEGIRIRPWRSEDLAATWHAHQMSFADHWDFESVDLSEWRYMEVDRRDDFDGSLWMLAVTDAAPETLARPELAAVPLTPGGEVVVGIALGHVAADDVTRVEIRHLGVLQVARGAGVARRLLVEMFHAAAAAGATQVGLEVDDITEHGALRLYQQAGMRIARRFDVYVRDVEA